MNASKSEILGVAVIPSGFSSSPPDGFTTLPVLNPESMTINESMGLVTGKTGEGEDGGLLTLDFSSVKTDWILLMGEFETLDSQRLEDALPVIAGAAKKHLLATVKKRIDQKKLKQFEWVGTRNLFLNPDENVSTVFTQEPRLIPVEAAKTGNIAVRFVEGEKGAFSVAGTPPPIELGLSPIVIETMPPELEEEPDKPSDRDIFLKGHQAFYNDAEFAPRFVWPPSLYLLIRKAHIPGIIHGLEQGLGNTDILSYAFNYLTLSGDFESAEKMVPLVPDHWFAKDPMLAQVCGATLSMRGRMDDAVKYFELARSLDEDDSGAMFNLGKMYLVTGRRDQAVEVFEKCLEDPDLEEAQHAGAQYFITAMEEGMDVGVSISLCMIARDEEEALPRALNSVAGLADEIIVVDTGSTDSTKEQAEKFGAKVFDYPWDDDFSAARNFAMEKATGDYIFFLDADERLSPFHRINILFLKALMSRRIPRAYELPIGYTDVTTDWLVISALPDNFLQQTSSIRIFPRMEEVRFVGRAAESVGPSLEALAIPISSIPPGQMDIIHDEYGRDRRVLRKGGAYEKSESPGPALVATAIRDYSSIRDQANTLKWLKVLKDLSPDQTENRRLLLQLAKMMEESDPEYSMKTYRELLDNGPNTPAVFNAFSSFLVCKDDYETMANLDFQRAEQSFADASEAKSFFSHYAISALAAQDIDRAAEILEEALEIDPGFILTQAVRFLILSAAGVMEGALSALVDVEALALSGSEFKLDTEGDFMDRVETIAMALEKGRHTEERMLVLKGAALLVSGQEAI